jgi:methylmalonyl-CoA mutase N-terminal domain/subunit
VTAQQLDLLNKVKASRDETAVRAVLQRVRDVATDPNANTMPVLIEAVKTYATVGEISDALRDVFGTYQEPALF